MPKAGRLARSPSAISTVCIAATSRCSRARGRRCTRPAAVRDDIRAASARILRPEHAPTRIALLRDKLDALRRNGVDRVVVEHFNAHFAAQSPQAFVENVLWHGLHARWMLVGDDFRFGAKRAATFLSAGGRPAVRFRCRADGIGSEGGIRISSSAVRQPWPVAIWNARRLPATATRSAAT
jgi:hypothetical protein